jgi:hypothetical protein
MAAFRLARSCPALSGNADKQCSGTGSEKLLNHCSGRSRAIRICSMTWGPERYPDGFPPLLPPLGGEAEAEAEAEAGAGAPTARRVPQASIRGASAACGGVFWERETARKEKKMNSLQYVASSWTARGDGERVKSSKCPWIHRPIPHSRGPKMAGVSKTRGVGNGWRGSWF